MLATQGFLSAIVIIPKFHCYLRRLIKDKGLMIVSQGEKMEELKKKIEELEKRIEELEKTHWKFEYYPPVITGTYLQPNVRWIPNPNGSAGYWETI